MMIVYATGITVQKKKEYEVVLPSYSFLSGRTSLAAILLTLMLAAA